MIRSLTGTVTSIGDNQIVLDVRGVGYLIACPTLSHNFTEGERLTLQTHLAVRETALDLYGFPDKKELAMFELLLGINKVGPKSALQIMCQATPSLLIEAAQKNDGVYLHKLSGIGKKTCENIVDYLHKKLDSLPVAAGPIETEADKLNQTQTDAIDALIALGYDASTARESILSLPKEENATTNSLVTLALKQM